MSVWHAPTSAGTASASSGYFYISGSGTSITNCTITTSSTGIVVADDDTLWVSDDVHTALRAGQTYRLPDGSKIEIDADGNYQVLDEDARVIHKACRIRAFNRFLNASELLEQFIGDLAPLGVKQSEVLKIPVEAFINWLIYKAAEADGELPGRRRHSHRCGQCKRFIPTRMVALGINFCSPLHLERRMQRLALPAP